MELPRANFAWLWKFVSAHLRQVLGAIACGILAGITTSLSSYLIGAIIDRIRVHAQLVEILNDTLLLVLLVAISAAAFFGQRLMSGYVAVAVHCDISRVLFDNLLTLEQDFYQQYPIGDLISRIYSDVDLIWRLLALTLTRIGSAVLTLVVTIGLLATIHVPLTLLVVLILGVSAAVQTRVGKRLAPIFESVQAQEGAMTALVQDAFSGIQTIKTFGSEAVIGALYRERNVEYRRRWLFYMRRDGPIGMIPNMISQFTAALVVVVGGALTLTGTLTLGNFVQFLVYLQLISAALLQVATIYQRYQQTRGALARIEPLLVEAKIKDATGAKPLPTPRGEIVYDHVGVKVGEQWLIRDVSLTIPAGSTFAIVGPTGCGKTLLVSLLARVIDPTEGRVLIDGIDVRELSLADLRRAIAYVPQLTFLFSLPLHNNVRMGGEAISDETLDQAIHTSRVSNDLAQLPHGLDTLVGERGVMLSGGQKQRVAIARAIVRNPAILVLDDALSSVDMQTAADILNDLRHVLESRTSLIIAHRMATIKDADQVVVMAQGTITEQGSYAGLIAAGQTFARMVEREAQSETRQDATVDDLLA